MNKEDFYKYLQGDKLHEDLSLIQLEQITEKYPYFQTAKLLLLKNLKDKDVTLFASKLNRFSFECADRERLFYYLDDGRFARFFSKEPGENNSQSDRTELLLHSFLESLDDENSEYDKSSDTQKLETESIVSSDYLAYLEKTELQENHQKDVKDSNPMKHQQLVDTFLEKSQSDETLFSASKRTSIPQQDSSQDVDSLLDDDSFLTETLAQVYIKQKKYEQALTIIKRLSLNFPKKSIYFADQIRFLEYLIINDKNKKQK